MKTRDYDYIEARLLDAGPAVRAVGRLRQVGEIELAQRVMAAAQEYEDKLRAVRAELRGKRGTQ